MKAILKWLAGVVGTVIALVATIALLPYGSDLVNAIMPDVTSAAERTAAVLSSKMVEKTRLESIFVTETGTVNHEFVLYSVSMGNVTFDYEYSASFGIDLSKVQMIVSGGRIVFLLPEPELILDSLDTSNNSVRAPLVHISNEDFNGLVEQERIRCRERYTSGEKRQELWDASVRAMQNTVEMWLTEVDSRLTFEYALLETEDSGTAGT